MVEQCGKAPDLRPYHVARACTLAPDAVPDASLPGRLAKKELQDSAGEFWSLTEQGALAYRAGRFQEAVHLFEQSLGADSKPGHAVVNWLWLALANQRLGKAEERGAGWTRPRRGSISTVTGCRPVPKRSSGCTSTTGWKRTSCAARRKH